MVYLPKDNKGSILLRYGAYYIIWLQPSLKNLFCFCPCIHSSDPYFKIHNFAPWTHTCWLYMVLTYENWKLCCIVLSL